MAVEETFFDLLNAIKGSTTADEWRKIAYYGINAASNPVKVLQNAGYDVTVNSNGEVLSYTRKIAATMTNTATNVANVVNSNTQTGTAAASNTAIFNSIGDVTSEVAETGESIVSGGSTLSKYTNGVKGVLNTPVAGKVAPAIIAAMTGVKLGKAIDSTIYNIGTALGVKVPESLDPDTWSSITVDMGSTGWEGVDKWAFNTILGIDSDNKVTAYIDENAFAYMARYLVDNGYLDNGESIIQDGTTIDGVQIPNGLVKHYLTCSESKTFGTLTFQYLDGVVGERKGYPSYLQVETAGTYLCGRSGDYLYIASDSVVPQSYIVSGDESKYSGQSISTNLLSNLYNNKTVYYRYINQSGLTISGGSENIAGAYHWVIPWVLLYGDEYFTTSSVIDGISTINGATVPTISNGLSQSEMLTKLQELYPELWENRVENEVLQNDGTTKTVVYIPLPIPTGGEGTAVDTQGNTQNDSAVSEGTGTETQLSTIIKWLTQTVTDNGEVINPNTDYDPTGMVSPETGIDPKTGDPTTGGTDNPGTTGTGDTPVLVLPSGKASSLYAIYNPTLEEINSFGAWLWSSDFIDQILKLFSDPMQAIIGLHKIYATPQTGDSQNIKVGYLDSGVSSKVVADQYTTIDCGTLNLFEYFGNVFDYDPYTQIRLYLPFIGIVNLATSDCMRGVISVVYHVDVLSGACLAEVKITRDGVGGTLYQFAGNASVTMPISSGSYIGVIANVVGVASSVIGGFASGGALGAVAGGVTGALTRRGGTEVQHSGNFSGSAGAMGIKTPYLIIERPQTELATDFQNYMGYPSNKTVVLSTCSGYIKVKEVHLENVPATGDELAQIETLLKGGVLI